MTKCCGTCSSLKVLPDRDGKIRLRKTETYACIVHVELPVLPACSNLDIERSMKSSRRRMGIAEGADCTFWSERP